MFFKNKFIDKKRRRKKYICQRGRRAKLVSDFFLTKGGGVGQFLTLADKGGRGGIDLSIFGWPHVWAAPKTQWPKRALPSCWEIYETLNKTKVFNILSKHTTCQNIQHLKYLKNIENHQYLWIIDNSKKHAFRRPKSCFIITVMIY